MDPYEHFNTYDLLWIINIQWLCTSSRTTNVLNNETNINPIKRHCCLWLTFWILNNTHNAPLLSRGLPQVTFDLPGTCWIQIKCRFVLLRLNKLNPSTRNTKLADHVKYLHSEIFLQTHRKGEGLKTWRNHNKPHEIAQKIWLKMSNFSKLNGSPEREGLKKAVARGMNKWIQQEVFQNGPCYHQYQLTKFPWVDRSWTTRSLWNR